MFLIPNIPELCYVHQKQAENAGQLAIVPVDLRYYRSVVQIFSGLRYSISIDSDFSIKKIVKSDENVFINEVISTTFQFLRHFCKKFSSPLECNLELSLASCFYGAKNDHSKTGLGSSAVVTVLLTFSILKCFAVDCTNEMLFALAYRAHAIAQGKVGLDLTLQPAFLVLILFNEVNWQYRFNVQFY